MTNPMPYIFESILDDIDVQDMSSANAANTLADNVNNSNKYPDPYIDTDYDFELEIYTPSIRVRSREKIVALINNWTSNLDTVMETSRQITAHTRSVFYSAYEDKAKALVGDSDLIREPFHRDMYGTAVFVRFNHNFRTAAQIMKFVCQCALCVYSFEKIGVVNQDINIRIRYFTNGSQMKDCVFSWASHIIDKLLKHKNIDNYVGIDRTILTLT